MSQDSSADAPLSMREQMAKRFFGVSCEAELPEDHRNVLSEIEAVQSKFNMNLQEVEAIIAAVCKVAGIVCPLINATPASVKEDSNHDQSPEQA